MLGLPDETWGEIVAAAVRTHEPAADGLADDLATPSGKVQKFVLREQLIP